MVTALEHLPKAIQLVCTGCKTRHLVAMHCARNVRNQLDRWDYGEGKEEAGDVDLPGRVLMRRRDGGGGGSPHPPLSNVGNVGNLRWGEGGGEGGWWWSPGAF